MCYAIMMLYILHKSVFILTSCQPLGVTCVNKPILKKEKKNKEKSFLVCVVALGVTADCLCHGFIVATV